MWYTTGTPSLPDTGSDHGIDHILTCKTQIRSSYYCEVTFAFLRVCRPAHRTTCGLMMMTSSRVNHTFGIWSQREIKARCLEPKVTFWELYVSTHYILVVQCQRTSQYILRD